MSFKNLGLEQEIIQAIEEKGYTEATPIQIKAIPLVIEGHDLLASAQTGTGKTAGFTLPLLQVLINNGKNKQHHGVRALILTPTRELAAQVGNSVKTYGAHLPFKTHVVFGGVNLGGQIRKLQRGADILVATPGRLLDLVSQRAVDLSQVEILVLDEADRMLDMGFIQDIKRIIKLLPAKRQNLLFSATFNEEVKRLAGGILKDPQTIEVAKQNAPTELVTHIVFPVDKKRKKELLSFLITSNNWKQVLVFTRTKQSANKLAQQLTADGIKSDAIHGNKSQSARSKALGSFKVGAIKVLVATDIASRGIDINDLPYVVNYELPNVPEDYIHRIGRTGRAGKEGWACSLVCVDEHKFLADIERLLKRKIEKKLEPGFDIDPNIAAEPIQQGRYKQSAGQRHGGRHGGRSGEGSGGQYGGRQGGRHGEGSGGQYGERHGGRQGGRHGEGSGGQQGGRHGEGNAGRSGESYAGRGPNPQGNRSRHGPNASYPKRSAKPSFGRKSESR